MIYLRFKKLNTDTVFHSILTRQRSLTFEKYPFFAFILLKEPINTRKISFQKNEENWPLRSYEYGVGSGLIVVWNVNKDSFSKNFNYEDSGVTVNR